MVFPVTAYMSDRQRNALFSRARRNGTSLSAEVRRAIDLYLDLSPDFECESFKSLAREATESLNRSSARLDEAIAYCNRTMQRIQKLEYDRGQR